MPVFDIVIDYNNNERSKPMKRFIVLLLFVAITTISVFAEDIKYGYNAHGDYVPTSINGKSIKYGYNAHGDYVPTSINGQKVQYGYNAHGEYVPTGLK